ncbi:unnamed protein product [Brassica oleracea var. botrytis]
MKDVSGGVYCSNVIGRTRESMLLTKWERMRKENYLIRSLFCSAVDKILLLLDYRY